MSYRMICLMKQVPDTRNITLNALREDGTVNRQALPAIVNPDDLFALEMALGIKDIYGGRSR
jgi:electron transfer flavoprotein beta subunit